MDSKRHLGIDHEDLTPSVRAIKVYRYPPYESPIWIYEGNNEPPYLVIVLVRANTYKIRTSKNL